MKDIIIDDIIFKLYKGGRYYVNLEIKKRLHIYVWEKTNGVVLEGYHIHHKDENRFNNDISNLEMIKASKHLSEHSKERCVNNKEWFDRFQALGIEKAKEWHKSDKGREWHKKHYEEMKDKLITEKTLICECCGKEYKTTGNTSRFCSNKCKAKYRRDSGIDNEIRICVFCGKEYEVNKYAKTITCGRSCAGKYRQSNKGRV